MFYGQFEEQWPYLGNSAPSLQSWSMEKIQTPIPSTREGIGIGLPNSLLMEDCFLDQEDMMRAFLMEPCLNLKSQSLFRERKYHLKVEMVCK